jgi:putative membrane protein
MTDRPITKEGALAPQQRTTELEVARERELRDVERTMISIVQASISMIGFGFTIHAFLGNVEAEGMVSIDLDQVARRIGLALVSLGLLNLAWGVWNQRAQLRVIRRRYPAFAEGWNLQVYSTAPTFVVASLLLAIGVVAFASMIARAIG